MQHAGCGVEGEVGVGGYARGEPAFGGCPFDGEHVVFGVEVDVSRLGQLGVVGESVDIPVKLRPKTSSLYGRRSLGEVFFLISSLEGSILGRRAMNA